MKSYTTVHTGGSRGKVHVVEAHGVITACGVFLRTRAPSPHQLAGHVTCGHCYRAVDDAVLEELNQRATLEAQS